MAIKLLIVALQFYDNIIEIHTSCADLIEISFLLFFFNQVCGLDYVCVLVQCYQTRFHM